MNAVRYRGMNFRYAYPFTGWVLRKKNKSFNYLLNTHTHTHTRTQQPFSLFEHFSYLSFLFATFFSGLVFPIDCFDYTLFLLFPCFHSVCVVFPHTIIMINDNLWYGGFTTSFERCISVFCSSFFSFRCLLYRILPAIVICC